ncbi:hypothetical protein CDAR_542581 [Caerostris darwini]|uniref:Uncharacterized protein n=1 Tax=Caerostris darwini TaxID=1538125 RepID=A0AAV4RSD5_9ARAC|nr:hypothetical protein CDAR_542581 [Caerostris darwini]
MCLSLFQGSHDWHIHYGEALSRESKVLQSPETRGPSIDWTFASVLAGPTHSERTPNSNYFLNESNSLTLSSHVYRDFSLKLIIYFVRRNYMYSSLQTDNEV